MHKGMRISSLASMCLITFIWQAVEPNWNEIDFIPGIMGMQWGYHLGFLFLQGIAAYGLLYQSTKKERLLMGVVLSIFVALMAVLAYFNQYLVLYYYMNLGTYDVPLAMVAGMLLVSGIVGGTEKN